MKVGDIICRRDIPQHRYRIVGQSQDWNAWETEKIGSTPGLMKKGLVFKDDERWGIVQ